MARRQVALSTKDALKIAKLMFTLKHVKEDVCRLESKLQAALHQIVERESENADELIGFDDETGTLIFGNKNAG